jgi:hypothetical protein
MNRDSFVGLAGTFASFTLDTIHLVAATICAVLTAVHLSVSIYLKLKGKGNKDDRSK